jgi:hypothetical protein
MKTCLESALPWACGKVTFISLAQGLGCLSGRNGQERVVRAETLVYSYSGEILLRSSVGEDTLAEMGAEVENANCSRWGKHGF